MKIRNYSTYKDSRFYVESIGENYSTIFDKLIRLTAKLTEAYAGDIYYELSEIERLRNKFIKKSYTTDPKGEIIRILLATNAEHREIYTLLKDRKKEQVADYIAHTHWSPERSRFDLMGDEA